MKGAADMLKVKTKDGTEFVATGGEAKESVAHLNSLIDDHNTIARLYRTAKSIKPDTTFLVRQYDGDPCAVGEAVTLKGVRRKQFEFVVSYLRRHPSAAAYEACRASIAAIREPGGYPHVDSLHRYCMRHPHLCFGAAVASGRPRPRFSDGG